MERKDKVRIHLYLNKDDIAFIEQHTPPDGMRYPSISFVVRKVLHDWVEEKKEKGIESI